MEIIRKIFFCFIITADLPSFFRLLINSKRFTWSKSREVPPHKLDSVFHLNIKFKKLYQTIYLRTYKGDIDIFYEIFYRNIYSLPANINDIKLIIDLGANVGMADIYFSAMFPLANIICVEPSKENYSILLKNLASGIKTKKISTLNAAAMGSNGMVSFEDGNMKYNGKVINGSVKNTLAISMSTLFETFHIDKAGLVKIDIEGSEKDIFLENVDWLAAVDNVIIEMHSEDIRKSCLAVLEKNLFNINKISKDPDNNNLFWAKKN